MSISALIDLEVIDIGKSFGFVNEKLMEWDQNRRIFSILRAR
jgi:hypothetical protein